MLGINYHRYEGFPLDKKIKWLREGTGSSAIETLHQGMANIGGKFADSDQQLRRQLEPLGIAWQGRAASEAGAALGASAVKAEAHSDAGRAAGASVDGYGMSFGEMSRHLGGSGRELIAMDVQRAMSLPSGAPFLLLGPIGGPFAIMAAEADQREAVEQVRTIDAKTNAALYVHEDTSRQALDRFPVAGTTPAADPPNGVGAGGGPGGGFGGGGPGAGGLGTGVGTPPVGAVGDLTTPARHGGIAGLPESPVRHPDPTVLPPGVTGGARAGDSSMPRVPHGPPMPQVPGPPPGTIRSDLSGVTTPGPTRGVGTSRGRGFADKLLRAGGGQGIGEPTSRTPAGVRDAARPMIAGGRPGGSACPAACTRRWVVPRAGVAGTTGTPRAIWCPARRRSTSTPRTSRR
ncbi:MAG: hypothetical protein ABS81_30740 [Pseudonocardia sp. SCN 72-86]|nr:MAG: hypothetical protein ABS81_30740 [Pseudonocardia sp. SCN 72-86]